MISTQDTQILVPRSHEYVVLQEKKKNQNTHTKKNFAGVIKLKTMKWEIILDYLGRPMKAEELV
jgi:hypothetical protein